MNTNREGADWNEVFSFAAKIIPSVREEYLKGQRSDSEQGQERQNDSARKTNGRDWLKAISGHLKKYKVELLLLVCLTVCVLLIVAGCQRRSVPPQMNVGRSLEALGNFSTAKESLEEESNPADKNEYAPMIERSAVLSIVVKDCVAARSSLEELLVRHHGYSAELTVGGEQNGARSLQASLRIPAGELAAAIKELRAFGKVESESQKAEEVTQQHSDLLARLKNSRETEQRLQGILQQRTGKMSDVLEVEQEISRVRGEVERMEAEQRALEHRVDFATVDLHLGEEYHAQLATPSLGNRFRNATVNGFQSAADSIVAMVIFCMNYGPLALLWLGILFIPGRMLWRRSRGIVAKAAM